MNELHAWLM